MDSNTTGGSANAFLNSLLQKGTTSDLYQTYYKAISAPGGTADTAIAAVQAYITNAGYPSVTTDDVSSALTTVAGGNYTDVNSGSSSNPTYPPFGTQPSQMYGTYQTFDSSGQPSLLIMVYDNNGHWQLKVATPSSGALIDITSSCAWQGQSGEFFVASSPQFPYNGKINFSSCVVTYNNTPTTDFDIAVALTPSTGAALNSSGRRSVYSSEAALAPATVDSPSLWAGTYACVLNKTTNAPLVISSDGSSLTFQGKAANSTKFSPFTNYFKCVIGNNTLLIYMQWTYYEIFAGNTFTGPNFFGYFYPTGDAKPSSPNLYGNLGTTPPAPTPPASQSAAQIWAQIGIQLGVGI
jgi:hypothetical protein